MFAFQFEMQGVCPVSATGPHYVRMEKLRVVVFFLFFFSFCSERKEDTLVRRVDSLDR